jgi:hypothetical protein
MAPFAFVLKTVINHTMNIQSKDFERMPYPWWVPAANKTAATERVIGMIEEAKVGRHWKRTDPEINELAALYEFRQSRNYRERVAAKSPAQESKQTTLF